MDHKLRKILHCITSKERFGAGSPVEKDSALATKLTKIGPGAWFINLERLGSGLQVDEDLALDKKLRKIWIII